MDKFAEIESAAHSGAFGSNGYAHPSASTAYRGTYLKGRAKWAGLDLVIEQPRYSFREGVGRDGEAWKTMLHAHYGYFSTRYGRGADGDGIDIFIGPVPESAQVWCVNQVDPVSRRFDEHKWLICFGDETSATKAYLNSYSRGWRGIGSVVPATVEQLKWWLKHGNKSAPLAPSALPYDGENDMNVTAFDSSADEATLSKLIYAIRKDDADGLMFDAITVDDILADSDGELALDALVVPFAKLERKMNQLQLVMSAAGGEIKPLGVQISAPFKQKGTVNVASVFELSDGQTVSIYFHNPDTTPGKITPADDMVSWKWLLNKKDITILVAPEQGKDLNVREVSRRIMRLAEKNSMRFQQANKNRAARIGAIADLKTTVEAKQAELSTLVAEVSSLEVEAQTKAESIAAAVISAAKGSEDAFVKKTAEYAAAVIKNPAINPVMRLSIVRDFKKDLNAKVAPAASEQQADDWTARIDEVQKALMTFGWEMVNDTPMKGDFYVRWKENAYAQGEAAAQVFKTGSLTPAGTIRVKPLDVAADVANYIDMIIPGNEGDQAWKKVNPVTEDGYAKIRLAGAAALEYWQDRLDSKFQDRIIDVRSALRGFGWDGEQFKTLSKNGISAIFNLEQVGAGKNLVGYTVKVDSRLQEEVRDDLSMTPEAFAEYLNGLLPSMDAERTDFKGGMVIKLASAVGVGGKVYQLSRDGQQFAMRDESGSTKTKRYSLAELQDLERRGLLTIVPGNDPEKTVEPDNGDDMDAAVKYAAETKAVFEAGNIAAAFDRYMADPNRSSDGPTELEPWVDAMWDDGQPALWSLPAEKIKAWSEAEYSAVEAALENWNFHSQNVILMAKRLGSSEDVIEAQEIEKRHRMDRGLSADLMQRRNALVKKIEDGVKLEAGEKAPFMMTENGMVNVYSGDGKTKLPDDWTGVAMDGGDSKKFWYIGQDNGERSFVILPASNYADALAYIAAKSGATESKRASAQQVLADLGDMLPELGWIYRDNETGFPLWNRGKYQLKVDGNSITLNAYNEGTPVPQKTVDFGSLSAKEIIASIEDKITEIAANDRAVEDALSDPTQAEYRPFDLNSLKMPTAPQLKVKTLIAGPISYDGNVGWTNGDILDVSSIPRFVQSAFDKITEDGGLKRVVAPESIDKVVMRAKAGATNQVKPIAARSFEQTIIDNRQIASGKGEQVVKMDSVILANEASGLVTMVNEKYIAYFAKVYKGCEFFAQDADSALIVRKAGRIVGVIMPMRGADAGMLKRAIKAASMTSKAETADESKPIISNEKIENIIANLKASEFSAGSVFSDGLKKIPDDVLRRFVYSLFSGGKHKVGDLSIVDFNASDRFDKYGMWSSDDKSQFEKYDLISRVTPKYDPENYFYEIGGENGSHVWRFASKPENQMVKQDQGNPETATSDPAMTEAKAFLATVIDGTADMMASETADRLISIGEKYPDDAEFQDMLNKAAEAYSAFTVAQAKAALA